jgi:hypothetical protein
MFKSDAIVNIIAGLAVISVTSGRRYRPSNVSPALDCYAAGWVRAPDLYPGLSTPADARLRLNGTDCDQVTEWQVGLRYKERSILRFA